ncbi:MAG TPA: FKBP-type peptidyl-prolyl cis-trans isomerase [Rhodocyclaceae bacterium]|nr:FKBP-type peptidyl-prolyl cis-trans isomerase [Rhodocyclaceae bacterium]
MKYILTAACLSLACAAHAADSKESKTASGITIKMHKEGSGASPKASDTVKVHYRGTLADGKEFDSSYKRGEPTSFPLNRVIPCWTEGIQLLKVGGKATLTCPPNLAYGSRGAGGVIPPNATLSFDVELLAIEK